MTEGYFGAHELPVPKDGDTGEDGWRYVQHTYGHWGRIESIDPGGWATVALAPDWTAKARWSQIEVRTPPDGPFIIRQVYKDAQRSPAMPDETADVPVIPPVEPDPPLVRTTTLAENIRAAANIISIVAAFGVAAALWSKGLGDKLGEFGNMLILLIPALTTLSANLSQPWKLWRREVNVPSMPRPKVTS